MNSQNQYESNVIYMSKTKKIVLTAILFALALILSIVENFLPTVPIPVPGIKFGLANIVVMYTLFFIGKSSAMSIVILKALFVLMTRGAVASFLSLTGGIFSILIMIILLSIFKDKISYLILSIFGAIFHNIGQFTAVSLIYTGMNLWFYLPPLLIFGVIAGLVTSIILRFILPALKSFGYK
jgi:heptaprenyl diphosphate synthase